MDLYYSPYSPPCGAVIMTAKALGIELNKKIITKEEDLVLFPEFLRINCNGNIPTLVSGNLVMCEYRTIMRYLIWRYAKTDSLIPKCSEKRVFVNEALEFNSTIMFQSLADYYYPQIFKNTPADPKMFKKIEICFFFFNDFLRDRQYAAGDFFSVADLALLATVSTFEIAGFDFSTYEIVGKWYANVKTIAPGFDEYWQCSLQIKESWQNKL